MTSDRSGSEKYHDAFKPDPKPRKGVKDPKLLREYAAYRCQITGFPCTVCHTHHLLKHPRHDEEDNLFRILTPLHFGFEQGTRRKAHAALIRAYMSTAQEDYLIREKGAGWVDDTYPNIEWMEYPE